MSVIERIDAALAALGERELVSTAEVADLLLDLRNDAIDVRALEAAVGAS